MIWNQCVHRTLIQCTIYDKGGAVRKMPKFAKPRKCKAGQIMAVIHGMTICGTKTDAEYTAFEMIRERGWSLGLHVVTGDSVE